MDTLQRWKGSQARTARAVAWLGSRSAQRPSPTSPSVSATLSLCPTLLPMTLFKVTRALKLEVKSSFTSIVLFVLSVDVVSVSLLMFTHVFVQVKGNVNWASDMDNYVGMRATVTRFTGVDSAGCRMVSLSVDDKVLKFAFRVRDLTLLQ